MISAASSAIHARPAEWISRSRPLFVHLSKDVLAGIQVALSQAGTRQPRLCLGGLLLGTETQAADGETAFFIQSHLQLEWDAARGGAPFLTDTQVQLLQETLASWPADRKVIGFYRTLRRSEVYDKSDGDRTLFSDLREADKAVLMACLRDSGASIGMTFGLPPALQPSVFGLWGESLLCDFDSKDFSPVPSRDDRPNTMVSEQRSWNKPSPQFVPEEQPVYLPLTPPSQPSAPSAQKRVLAISAWAVGTILLSVLTYVAAHLYLKPALLNLAAQAESQATPTSQQTHRSGLGLQVTQNGTALELSWDPLSPSVQSASSATLLITDGALVRQLKLDKDQMRTGRIIYTPVVGDVTFRLEVLDARSHTFSESLRIVGDAAGSNIVGGYDYPPSDSASPLSHQAVRQPSHGKTRVHSTDGAASRRNVSTSNDTNVAPSQPKHTSPDTLPAPKSTSIAQSPSEHMQPKQLNVAAGNDLKVPVPKMYLPRLQIPSSISASEPHPSVRSKATTNPKSTESLPPVSTGSAIPATASPKRLPPRVVTPAKTLVQVSPTLRPGTLFKDVLVPIMVKISDTGAVTSAELSPEAANLPAELTGQAIVAARKWRFSPATVNGKPVASEMKINFQFSRTMN